MDEDDEDVVIGCDSKFVDLILGSGGCCRQGGGDLEKTRDGAEVDPSSLLLVLAGRT